MSPSAGKASMTGSDRTVLVVDDDSDMRSLYRCWLGAADEVRTAADGVEALAQLDESVDVVLLDREMPRKDGVAVARELERRAIDPAIVMISGVEPALDLLDVPVDDYLRKPVSRETVRTRIDRAVAVATCPPQQRKLVALDTRRRIVESVVPRHRLVEDPNYQHSIDHLECEGSALADAQASVRAVVGDTDESQGSGPEPPLGTGAVDAASREPRQ